MRPFMIRRLERERKRLQRVRQAREQYLRDCGPEPLPVAAPSANSMPEEHAQRTDRSRSESRREGTEGVAVQRGVWITDL